MKKIAIIGAGISGLFFANLLRQNSEYEFTIYEKNTSIKSGKGYGIQLSVNSIELLNKINFQNFNIQNKFNPNKIDFYSVSKNRKICDLDISSFNTKEIKYTTMERSNLIEFLKEKLLTNSVQYSKKVNKINSSDKNIELIFDDHSSTACDYLIVSDGVFSSTKSLLFNKQIKPKYFKSIAIRGTLKNLNNINQNNISLFLGSNLHFVIYPLNKIGNFNFIGILKKNLDKDDLNNPSLFEDKNFISSILTNLSEKIDKKIIDNLREIRCFPIFVSNQIYEPKQKKTFLLGDAFFTMPPTFAQGASQSIEGAYELFENLKNNNTDNFIKFHNIRSDKIKMINKRSKFNYFAFHLSNPFMIFIRDIVLKFAVTNKRFLNKYFGDIYKNIKLDKNK